MANHQYTRDHSHSHEHEHEHEQNHSHDHNHSHLPSDKKILAFSFFIITGFMLVEFFGGWYVHSLALLADAGHMANDSLSLFLAWVALFLSKKFQRYFALLNGLSLVVVAMMILYEAIERWHTPSQLQALPMIAIAVLGLLVNIFVAWLMLKSDQQNLNVKSAYLHVLADLFGSVVAIVAGLCAWLFDWYWVDIVASAILGVFILKNGIGVVKQAWNSDYD